MASGEVRSGECGSRSGRGARRARRAALPWSQSTLKRWTLSVALHITRVKCSWNVNDAYHLHPVPRCSCAHMYLTWPPRLQSRRRRRHRIIDYRDYNLSVKTLEHRTENLTIHPLTEGCDKRARQHGSIVQVNSAEVHRRLPLRDYRWVK